MTDTEIAQLMPLPAPMCHRGSWFVGPVDAHPYPWPYDHSVDTPHVYQAATYQAATYQGNEQ